MVTPSLCLDVLKTLGRVRGTEISTSLFGCFEIKGRKGGQGGSGHINWQLWSLFANFKEMHINWHHKIDNLNPSSPLNSSNLGNWKRGVRRGKIPLLTPPSPLLKKSKQGSSTNHSHSLCSPLALHSNKLLGVRYPSTPPPPFPSAFKKYPNKVHKIKPLPFHILPPPRPPSKQTNQAYFDLTKQLNNPYNS